MLWAFATLGISPSASLLAALSFVADKSAGSFNPQDVANTLWAMAVLQIEPPSSLARHTSKIGTALNDKELEQISYAHLVGQALGWSMQLPNELVQRAQSVQRRLAQQPTVSRLQQRVYDARGMGQRPELEALTDDGLFSIDIALPESEQESRPKIAVEVDGPSHFTSSGSKTGNTQLRDFLLEQRGWRVVSLPYFAINAASNDAELTEYLADALLHKPRRSFPTMRLRLPSALMPCPASTPSSPRSPLPSTAPDFAPPIAPTAPTQAQQRPLDARAREFIPGGAASRSKQRW